jgi:hypothetical protein
MRKIIYLLGLFFLVSACSSEQTDELDDQAQTQNSANAVSTKNGKNGANCFDAPGMTDLNSDGRIDVRDCRGPQGVPGPAGLPGASAEVGSWKLLAKASNYSRVAEYELSKDGVSPWYSPAKEHNNPEGGVPDFVPQVSLADWPQKDVKEVLFVVRNLRDFSAFDDRIEANQHQTQIGFCVGGGADFPPQNPKNATCIDRRWRPDSQGRPTNYNAIVRHFSLDRWVRLTIDGSIMNQCDDPHMPRSPGKDVGSWGHSTWWDVYCTYTLSPEKKITKLSVQEVARVRGTAWQWEIYYR